MTKNRSRRWETITADDLQEFSILAVTSHRPEEIENSVCEIHADVHILRLDAGVGPLARAWTALRRTRRAIRRHDPDIVLLDCYETLGAPVTWVAARNDIPVVARLVGDPWRKLTEEQLEPARERRDLLRYGFHRTSDLLNEYIFERAAGFVVVSTDLRRVVNRQIGCAPEHIGVVPVPITTDMSRNGSATAARASLSVETERVLLTVTNLHFQAKFDGVDTIIAEVLPLLRADPELSYVVAGDGQYHADLVRIVEERIDDPDVRRRIHTPGYVDEVANLYALADVFVYVSDLDGYPNVVLEAQTAGLPVVANDAHGMCDQITDGETGFLVDPDRAGEVRERISFLLERASARRRLGEQARRRAHRENDPGVVSDRLEAVLLGLHGETTNHDA